jgi:hypothetical protein
MKLPFKPLARGANAGGVYGFPSIDWVSNGETAEKKIEKGKIPEDPRDARQAL